MITVIFIVKCVVIVFLLATALLSSINTLGVLNYREKVISCVYSISVYLMLIALPILWRE